MYIKYYTPFVPTKVSALSFYTLHIFKKRLTFGRAEGVVLVCLLMIFVVSFYAVGRAYFPENLYK